MSSLNPLLVSTYRENPAASTCCSVFSLYKEATGLIVPHPRRAPPPFSACTTIPRPTTEKKNIKSIWLLSVIMCMNLRVNIIFIWKLRKTMTANSCCLMKCTFISLKQPQSNSGINQGSWKGPIMWKQSVVREQIYIKEAPTPETSLNVNGAVNFPFKKE